MDVTKNASDYRASGQAAPVPSAGAAPGKMAIGRALRWAAASLFLACMAGPGAAADLRDEGPPPVCTDNSRSCMIAAVRLYIDALATHDSSKVPFASTVERWELGSLTGKGVPHTRAVMDAVPDLVMADPRFFVDAETGNVFLFSVIRIPRYPQGPRSEGHVVPASVHHSERWRVRDGRIQEIEAIFMPELGSVLTPSAAPRAGLSIGALNWPRIALRSGPATPLKASPLCEEASRNCLVRTARAYLDGLLANDLAAVPLASDWVRTENGKVTGSGAIGATRASDPAGTNYAGRDENTRFWVDQDNATVIAYSMFRSEAGQSGNAPKSFHVAHRFHIEGGLISEVEMIAFATDNMHAINWPEPEGR